MKPAKQTIGLYYLLSGLNRLGFTFIFATYAIFLMKRGMSLFDLNVINSIYFLVVIFAELPTGAVADVYGRRKSFLVAAALYSAAMFVYYLSHSFTGFCLAEILAALGATCWSGTFQSWLVDRLKHHQYETPLFPIFARVSQIELLAGILGSLGGGYVANHSLSANWLISGGIFITCGVLAAFFMKEEYLGGRSLEKKEVYREEYEGEYKLIRHEPFKRKGYLVSKQKGLKIITITRIYHSGKQNKSLDKEYKEIVRNGLRIGIKNRTVRFLLLLGLALWFAEQAPNMQWQPFFQKDLQTNSGFGWISAGISVAMIVGAQIAAFLAPRWKDARGQMIFSTLMMATAIALSGMMKSFPAALTIFLTFNLFRGAYKPITDTLLNNIIPSRERTTVLSFANMVFSLGGWLGLLVSGYLADKVSIPYAWLISGFVLLAATVWLGKREMSR